MLQNWVKVIGPSFAADQPHFAIKLGFFRLRKLQNWAKVIGQSSAPDQPHFPTQLNLFLPICEARWPSSSAVHNSSIQNQDPSSFIRQILKMRQKLLTEYSSLLTEAAALLKP